MEADQDSSTNYWLRAVWQTNCAGNKNADNILGIVRYENAPTDAEPTSTMATVANNCIDEPLASLSPHVPIDVGEFAAHDVVQLGFQNPNNVFTWTINTSSLVLDWRDPTALKLLNGDSVFPTPYNVYPVSAVDEVCQACSVVPLW